MKSVEKLLSEIYEKLIEMSSLDGIIKYTPAKLTKSDYGWYVSYRVLDPESQKLKIPYGVKLPMVQKLVKEELRHMS